MSSRALNILYRLLYGVVVAAVVVGTVSCWCCSSFVILDPQLQMNENNNNKITQ